MIRAWSRDNPSILAYSCDLCGFQWKMTEAEFEEKWLHLKFAGYLFCENCVDWFYINFNHIREYHKTHPRTTA